MICSFHYPTFQKGKQCLRGEKSGFLALKLHVAFPLIYNISPKKTSKFTYLIVKTTASNTFKEFNPEFKFYETGGHCWISVLDFYLFLNKFTDEMTCFDYF